MKQFPPLPLLFFVAALIANPLQAEEEVTSPSSLPSVSFSIIKTSKVSVMERLLVPDGSYTKQVDSNFSAFLIKHNQDYVMLDSGLGSKIDEQYKADMPYWMRPFFSYETPVISARQQLEAAGYPLISKIILSHSHWDHASGVQDFPQAQVMVAANEMQAIDRAGGGGDAWESQVASPSIHWAPVAFTSGPYKGYSSSLDLYGDGSVVLVPMPGHTEGSMGVFVTVDSGKCYFFIGDVAWKVAALQAGAPKFFAASMIVDGDREQTLSSVKQVQSVMQQYPELVVVPAHDGTVQDSLGYFPSWIK